MKMPANYIIDMKDMDSSYLFQQDILLGNNKLPNLSLDSTLSDLPSSTRIVDLTTIGSKVASMLEDEPDLPGVIVFDQDEIFGIVSRRKFLENVGKPFGVEVYMKRPISTMLPSNNNSLLILSSETKINDAAQKALQRSKDNVFEPIVIDFGKGAYRLLDLHLLLLAQSIVLEQMNKIIKTQKDLSETLRVAGQEIGATFEIQEILNITLKYLDKVVDFSNAYIFLSEDNELWLKAVHGHSLVKSNVGKSFLFSKPPFYEVYKYQKPVLIPNTLDDKRFVDWPFSAKIGSWLGVPLQSSGKFLGIIMIEHCDPMMFNVETINTVQDFSNQTSGALHNAIIYQTERKHAKEISTLNKATSSLVSTHDPQELIKQILISAINSISSAVKGVFYIVDSESGQFHLGSMIGYEEWMIHSGELKELDEYVHLALDKKKPVLLQHDSETNSYYENTITLKTNEKKRISRIIIPLLHENNVVGVLCLEAVEGKRFSDHELSILKVFGVNASAVIRNSQLHAELEQLAIKDPLTGLLNRRGFYRMARYEISNAQRYKRELSLIMIDIDLFKRVNDEYGHDIGDLVIRMVGENCKDVLRSSDLSCRFGGEEFIILLPEAKITDAEEVSKRLHRSIANSTVNASSGLVSVTVSMGITNLDASCYSMDPGITLETLLSRADRALYSSKLKGRNRISIWNGSQGGVDELPEDKNKGTYEYYLLAETLHQREAELKWMEASRQATEEHLASILENASESIISVNELDRILIFNKSAEKMLGYSAAEVLGLPLDIVFPDDENLINWKSHLAGSTENGYSISSRNIYQIKTKNGKIIPVEASHSGFRSNGQTIYTVIMTNISDRLIAEEKIHRSNKELTKAYEKTIEGWAAALEIRDLETLGHSNRVVDMTMRLAHAVGVMDEERDHMRRGALLHDIGKLSIPDYILFKPGKLTDEEWETMKQHPQIAYDLLSNIEFLHPALDIPLYHHERWNGSGYPKGLKETQIPLAARIFAVVDVWDALRSKRPYREAWSFEKTMKYMNEESGRQFDPEILAVFLDIMNTEKEIRANLEF